MAKRDKRNNLRIPDPVLPEDENIKFSFKFYDTNSNDFCLSKWEEEKISATLKVLQDVNRKSYAQLFREKVTYRFHSVLWEQTTKKNGFPDRAANNLEPFQFSLIGVNGQKARVYGALAQNIFYIIWFDLEHKIWPTLKKHT